MSGRSEPPPERLDESVERRRGRRARWEREGERSLARNLAMIGSFGWLVVIPSLAGAFLGQWIDRRTGGGLTFTGALLVLGVVLGCWLVWRRMQSA